MDFEEISKVFVRELRGTRSQVAFSRRLKYKSNVAYLWESGKRWPTAAVILAAADRLGQPVQAHLQHFLQASPDWLDEAQPMTEWVPRFLQHLKGKTPIQTIAARTGMSRFSISRWLKGTSQPRLPEFLRLIEGISLRLLDFLALFFDPGRYDVTRKDWEKLVHGREHFFAHPQSQMVLLALDLDGYRALPEHSVAWIARHLALSEEEVAHSLGVLAESRQIRWNGTHWTFGETLMIDMQSHPEAVRGLKAWWGDASLRAFQRHVDGVYSYNLFTVSQSDFEKLQELQRATFRAMRAIIAGTQSGERLVLAHLAIQGLNPIRMG